MTPDARTRKPTWFLDCDSPRVQRFAREAAGGASGAVERAVRLFYAVRDGIRYDPYAVSADPEAYRASAVADLPSAFCIQKAVLLAAAARSLEIPSRLGFADVRNHLTSPKLRQRMGTDLFVFHGYAELFLEGRWVKATVAFDARLCERFGVLPLEFDGRRDAVLQPFDAHNRRHMEYVRDRGTYTDLPLEDILRTFRQTYPGLFDPCGSEPADDLFAPRTVQS